MNGIGSVHTYDFDSLSLTPVGDCLYQLTDPSVSSQDLADVVVGHERTAHGTWLHRTVRMIASESIGRPRPEVVRKALVLMTGRC